MTRAQGCPRQALATTSRPIRQRALPVRDIGAGRPRVYRDLLDVAADAGRPLRAGEFAAAAGLSTEKATAEGLRSKLKLLAARGWLAPVAGGLFTLPGHAGKH